jgi:hypothetical protein
VLARQALSSKREEKGRKEKILVVFLPLFHVFASF